MLKRIASALEAQVAEEQSPDDKDRAERNVEAGEQVARWIPWILVVATLEMLVTLFGVILIRGTLIHTRRAANAAISQVAVMRAASEDQLRPYVLAERCDFG
jgi:hypothetical protein